MVTVETTLAQNEFYRVMHLEKEFAGRGIQYKYIGGYNISCDHKFRHSIDVDRAEIDELLIYLNLKIGAKIRCIDIS